MSETNYQQAAESVCYTKHHDDYDDDDDDDEWTT